MLEVLTPNVMLSGLKLAEDSEAVIIRLYEFDGEETEAEVWICDNLAAPGAPVVETDLLEQPLPASTAGFADGVLRVTIPPYGIATIRIG
jgi:alpha-mannosidase